MKVSLSFHSINLKNLTIAIDSDFNKSNKVIYYTQTICPSIPHIYVLFNVNILPMIRGCGMTLTWGNWPNQSHNQMEFTIRSPSWTFFKLAFIWFLISSFFFTVGEWTTNDLVREYKKGCESHGIKPLTKVVQQLQVRLLN